MLFLKSAVKMCYRHSSPRRLHIIIDGIPSFEPSFTSFENERLRLIVMRTSWCILVCAILGVYLTTNVIHNDDGDVEAPKKDENVKVEKVH
jgi:hypothetical protein